MTTQPYWNGTLVELDEIDSTNNYAIRCISEGMAEHGWAVRANYQTAGRGQMGNVWESPPAENLLCSVVLAMHGQDLRGQFVLNATLCSAITAVLRETCHTEDIYIKWPNDIYFEGKKLGGILIENQIRGASWTHAILGFGINVNQTHFHAEQNACSLYEISGRTWPINALTHNLLNKIKIAVEAFLKGRSEGMALYHRFMKHRHTEMEFIWNNAPFRGILQGVGEDGCIQLDVDGTPHFFKHKEITWSDSAWR
ncbi:MAG: biotin--[acetyl-CoA-carboxylase] ligase [Chitinophagaceae bacterium]